jgi:DNA-damage-inducible protein D
MIMNQTPDFDSIKQVNPYGEEYWSARSLMLKLGYKRWDYFIKAIQDAIHNLQTNEQKPENHISYIRKKVPLGSGAEREIDDYYLSRFGCYLIAMNGDPRKPEIAAAQIYFAVTTRAHEIHQLRMEQEQRLETRLRVSESFKQLAAASSVAGVLSENFGLFVDAGYLGLHHATVEELKAKKGVPPQEDYLDNIGREELSAIDFKNTQTEGKLRYDQVDNEDTAIKTHFFVGGEVRKAIEAIHAPMPETLPPAPSIRKMVEERRRAARKRRVKADQQQDQPSLLDSGDEP